MNEVVEKALRAIQSEEDKIPAPSPNIPTITYESKRQDLELRNFAQDIGIRGLLAWWIYGFAVFFVISTLALIYFCAFSLGHLSDSVLIALATTMTTTIVSLLVFVVKYFFPNAHGNGN